VRTDEVPTAELWELYRRNRNSELRNKLVSRYMHLVKIAAERVAPDLPGMVDREELLGAGALGLMQAIERFDHSHGAKFETYCSCRIRGAMIDELRNFDWMTRPMRSKAHRIRDMACALAHTLGRIPTDQEVARNMGLTQKEYNIVALHASSPVLCSLNGSIHDEESEELKAIDVLEDCRSPEPSEILEKREVSQIVTEVIRSLPSTDRLVILLYYYDRLTMKQIGQVLEITESRICQIHTEVIAKLRRRLQARKEDLMARTQ